MIKFNAAKIKRKSIAIMLTETVLLLLFVQSLLLCTVLIVGGVLSKTEENAYKAFNEKVNNRMTYLQGEMRNRWTNIDFYTEQVSSYMYLLGDSDIPNQEDVKNFWDQTSPILISMLRSSAVTDCFIVLNDNPENKEIHSALYFRDYDPLLNNSHSSDISLVAGPADIANKFHTTLDSTWKYSITLNNDNWDFYHKPFDNAYLSSNSKLLGYWCPPFSLTPEDAKIVTYSLPLLDSQGKAMGVIGVGVSLNYLNKHLPAAELSLKDSMGYIIGYQKSSYDSITPLITNGALQKSELDLDKPFSLSTKNITKNIYNVKNYTGSEKLFACVEKISLYDNNTPFQNEQWLIMGLMKENQLLNFTKNITILLIISFIGSILFGTVCGIFASYQFTKPIVALAKRVRKSDLSTPNPLEKTGLSEIDDLVDAIETANKKSFKSTVKVSQIIDLVNVPLGAFEYNTSMSQMLTTSRLWNILSISECDAEKLSLNKELFIQTLEMIMRRPEPEEADVYKLNDTPDKWVKINIINNGFDTLGIASDVTEEIRGKMRIKFERDYDSLTKLCSRVLFGRRVVSLLEKGDLNVTAMIMLDIDDFKLINDTYGHAWGDSYLKITAEFLANFSNKDCIAGRRSGDEFYLFLYGFKEHKEIIQLVLNFYKTLDDNPIIFPDGFSNPIAISAGIAWYDEYMPDYDVLLALADKALYEAKNTNKGFYCEIHNKMVSENK